MSQERKKHSRKEKRKQKVLARARSLYLFTVVVHERMDAWLFDKQCGNYSVANLSETT